ncbi:MAG: FAD binding domain-containing protein [Pseudomonadota bacterium]
MSLQVTTCASLDEAGRALSASQTAKYLGGGTLVMRWVNEGDQSFNEIVRTTDSAAQRIDISGERVTLGAGVTMAMVAEHRDLVFLAPAARSVGGPAIRTMATVGGNLFAHHPYGDFTTALLALDAEVTMAGGQTQPLETLLAQRDRAGLVMSVTVNRPRNPSDFRFSKVARVKPKGISVLSIAALLPQQGGAISGARIAYGAMAPTPVRMPSVEQALEGARLDAAGVSSALARATDGLDPPTDPIATGWYRQEVAPVHLRRLLLGDSA